MLEPVDPARVVFDPQRLLAALARAGIEFVVIGGIAALLHGDDASTSDADMTVRRSRENLETLVAALRDLEARMLVSPNDVDEATVDVPIEVETFAPLVSARFLTRHGVLDVVLRTDGLAGYEQWRDGASLVDIGGGVQVAVASLEDVIRSKEAAGRPKDLAALPRLRALRDLIARRG